MDLFSRERDRLLAQVARIYGLSFTLVSMLCLVIPGSVSSTTLPIAIVPYALLIVSQWRMGTSRHLVWVILTAVAGLGAVVVITVVGPGTPAMPGGAIAAVLTLAGASIPSIALVLATGGARAVLLGITGVVVIAVTVWLTSVLQPPIRTLGPLVMGWALTSFIGLWINAAVPQVAERIARIGRAHRAERQASETEAQRRQSARLLHDTVLATLTLLAHSGVGVSADALREQASGDARLLRQLRLGSTPTPTASGEYNLTPVAESELGTTLESVKSRFGRMGLEVTWHGTGQLLLPSHVLDAFLLALAECLENVRRHSGVTQAHVTITEDAATVKAMVTDQGVGFELNDVADAKLGFKESVVARLRDVGGNARLFSAPGSGTTVVLEVPR